MKKFFELIWRFFRIIFKPLKKKLFWRKLMLCTAVFRDPQLARTLLIVQERSQPALPELKSAQERYCSDQKRSFSEELTDSMNNADTYDFPDEIEDTYLLEKDMTQNTSDEMKRVVAGIMVELKEMAKARFKESDVVHFGEEVLGNRSGYEAFGAMMAQTEFVEKFKFDETGVTLYASKDSKIE